MKPKAIARTAACIGSLLLLIILNGCGGGGGSSQPVPGGTASGNLRLLVGDNPADVFDAVLLTVDAITLLTDADSVELALDEPVVIDLLALQNLTDELLDAEVPAGSYSKIRLFISDLQLQTLDDNGAVLTEIRPPLPANGKVDLNPQGTFAIARNEDLVIEIDFDLDRSLKLTSTGASSWRFRPVVFVDVVQSQIDARISKLEGEIANIDSAGMLLELCDSDDLDDCVSVQLSESTLIADSTGMPLALGALIEGDEATAFGRYTDAGDQFDALLIAVGDDDNLERINGLLAAAITDGLATLTDDDDERMLSLLEGTVILDGNRNPILPAEIAPGTALEAWGVTPPDTSTLTAFLIQVDTAEMASDDDDFEAEGVLGGLSDGELTFFTDQQEEICILVDEATVFVQSEDDADNAESELIDLAEFATRLADGVFEGERLEIEVEGELIDDCWNAELVVVEIED